MYEIHGLRHAILENPAWQNTFRHVMDRAFAGEGEQSGLAAEMLLNSFPAALMARPDLLPEGTERETVEAYVEDMLAERAAREGTPVPTSDRCTCPEGIHGMVPSHLWEVLDDEMRRITVVWAESYEEACTQAQFACPYLIDDSVPFMLRRLSLEEAQRLGEEGSVGA